ncbi:FadR/GntR family transcriptional regulator [Allorhizocola rhizosphaerae]|uniref:FadR/GntR family transcriptional regulator n=1 Tax=Allorhizocola rhizosphaerae TaxID=1872709 RepID=UPI001B8C53BC|nr:FCD domain-containing protein [Allorhizocola rhizosphaerae]
MVRSSGSPSVIVDPVARHNLADELTARILRHIEDEKLGPGDRLPSTRALSARFAVATPTLREALRRLEATGAIEIRHGSGCYVRGDLARLILSNPNQAPLAAATLIDLLAARELIEPPLAEAATRQATEAEMDELALCLERADRELAEDARLHVANMDFHRAIGRFSGNAILAQVIASLLDIYGREQLTVMHLYDDRESDLRAHQGILAAMRARKPVRASQLMRDHLRDVREVISAALASSPR